MIPCRIYVTDRMQRFKDDISSRPKCVLTSFPIFLFLYRYQMISVIGRGCLFGRGTGWKKVFESWSGELFS